MAVMPDSIKQLMIKVQGGREYLPVSARVLWFRIDHPDWGIATDVVEINHEKQFAIFRASIFNEDGRIVATATKKEDVRGFGDYVEKAETGSVGRALSYAGYGTLSEDDDMAEPPVAARQVDGSVPHKQTAPRPVQADPSLPTVETLKMVIDALGKSEEDGLAYVWTIAQEVHGKEATAEQKKKWPTNQRLIDSILKQIEKESNADG